MAPRVYLPWQFLFHCVIICLFHLNIQLSRLEVDWDKWEMALHIPSQRIMWLPSKWRCILSFEVSHGLRPHTGIETMKTTRVNCMYSNDCTVMIFIIRTQHWRLEKKRSALFAWFLSVRCSCNFLCSLLSRLLIFTTSQNQVRSCPCNFILHVFPHHQTILGGLICDIYMLLLRLV